jgi:hypothetical protein
LFIFAALPAACSAAYPKRCLKPFFCILRQRVDPGDRREATLSTKNLHECEELLLQYVHPSGSEDDEGGLFVFNFEQRGFSFACSPHEMKHMLEVLSAQDVVRAVDAAILHEEVKSSTPDQDDEEIGH